MALDDDIHDHLDAKAAQIRLEAADLHEVYKRRDRRSRRTKVVAVVGTFALVVGGAVGLRLATGDDGDGIDLAVVDDGSPGGGGDSGSGDAAGQNAADDDAAGGDAAGDSPAGGAVAAESVSAFQVEVGSGSGLGVGPQWLVPWGGGFLSIGVAYTPLPLPELTEEMRDLFPTEVVELIDDDRPTTIDEAVERLQDAGLYDVVADIVLANPSVYDLLYGQPVPSELRVWQSSDGLEWHQLDDIGLPGGDSISFVTSDGEHLVVGAQQLDPVDPAEEAAGLYRPRGSTVTVSVTTDLESWENVELDPGAPPDAPDFVLTDRGLSGVAIGPDGWLATVQSHQWIDDLALLGDRLDPGEGGWGTSPTTDGLRVQVYPPYEEDLAVDAAYEEECCEPSEEFLVTWDDLGIEKATYDRYYGQENVSSVVFSAGWDGELRRVELPADLVGSFGPVGTEAGFLTLAWNESEGGSSLWFSSDGGSWSRVSTPADDGDGYVEVNSVIAVRGGALLSGYGADGMALWRGGPAGSGWTEVEIPGLPEGSEANLYEPSPSPAGFASVIDVAVYGGPDVIVEEVAYDHEGFRVTERNSTEPPYSTSITIVELAGGETVLDVVETFDVEPDGDYVEPPWRTYGDDSVIYVDPDTGDEIVSVPFEVSGAAWEQAWNDAMVAAGFDPASPPEHTPDLRLVATVDGVSWLVEDIDDSGSFEDLWPQGAAVNGDTVVVQIGTEFRTFAIG